MTFKVLSNPRFHNSMFGCLFYSEGVNDWQKQRLSSKRNLNINFLLLQIFNLQLLKKKKERKEKEEEGEKEEEEEKCTGKKSPRVSFKQRQYSLLCQDTSLIFSFRFHCGVCWPTDTHSHKLICTQMTQSGSREQIHITFCAVFRGFHISSHCLHLLLGQQHGLNICSLCRETFPRIWSESDFTSLEDDSFNAAQMIGYSW